METIWKFELKITDEQVIRVPEGTDILCVQVQKGKPFLWAIVDKEITTYEDRIIRTIGTGHEFEDGASLLYIGTYQLSEGDLVFHVFQKM